MGYDCQNFKDGQVLTAACLNKMEQGIVGAFAAVPPACDSKDCSKVLSYSEDGFKWVPMPEGAELDTTLTKSGKAADAKAVGNALENKQPKGNYVKTVNGTVPDANGNVTVSGGGSGGGSAAIIDVTELPTENINEDVFYRLTSGKIVFNGSSFSGWVCHCVTSLPETGETVYDGTNAVVYYNQQDGVGYGYVPDVMGSQMGISAGWYPLDALAPGLGLSYGGVVTTTEGNTEGTVYILLEYVMYSYKDGWHAVKGKTIGRSGGGKYSEVFNYETRATGDYSHAEGYLSSARGDYAHAEGYATDSYGLGTHSEGWMTGSYGHASHSEGNETVAFSGHAEGYGTMVFYGSHAEGYGSGCDVAVTGDAGATTYTITGGPGSITPMCIGAFACIHDFLTNNVDNVAYDTYIARIIDVDVSNGTITFDKTLSLYTAAENDYLDVYDNVAYANGSHTEGCSTIAMGEHQHVQGKYNVVDEDGRYAHIVGNGEWDDGNGFRSNAHTIDWSGVGWFAGGLKVGGTGQDDENAATVLTTEDMGGIVQAVIAALPNAEGASF